MTDLGKRNRYLLRQVAVGRVIAEMAKAHSVLKKEVLAIRMGVALTVEIEVIAQSEKTVVLASVMPPSELSAMPWSTLKWLCVNLLPRRMASP